MRKLIYCAVALGLSTSRAWAGGPAAEITKAEITCTGDAEAIFEAAVKNTGTAKGKYTPKLVITATGECKEYTKRPKGDTGFFAPACVKYGPDVTTTKDLDAVTIEPGKSASVAHTFSGQTVRKAELEVSEDGASGSVDKTIKAPSATTHCAPS